MSNYQNRFDRRDLVLAVVTGIIGAAATVMAGLGVVILTAGH